MSKEVLFSVTLKDCDVQTFRSGGPGGQHQNKTESGVRIIHRDSGAVGESRDGRSQHQNKRTAFERMVKSHKFQYWLTMRRRELETGKTLEERVAEMMNPVYIKTEIKRDGLWVEEEEEGD